MYDKRLQRLDANRLSIQTPKGLDVTVFANDEVPIEAVAVTELLQFLELENTIEQVAEKLPDQFPEEPVINQVAITPDFHKAKGIPVGTVISTTGFILPQAIGNDINCGMRLHTTDLTLDQVTTNLDDIETNCRQVYFGGGRNIPMNRNQREALLREGLIGLGNAVPKSQNNGIWSLFHEFGAELAYIERQGSLKANQTFGLNDFLGRDELTRDGQIGSISGGNHFVEIQRVDKIFDSKAAYALGLKPGTITYMIHTGSVSIGHMCGGYYRDVIRELFPKTLKHPDNGIFILPEGSDKADLFWDCMNNAANFAFANRLFLSLMMIQALRRSFPDMGSRLVYDAPHNLIWPEDDGSFTHRKGATTARSYEAMAGTPYAYYGEPVLVPGSMGASSFVLMGKGNKGSLCSASHGAGRKMARGEAVHGHDEEFKKFLKEFRVVTPADFRSQELRMRPDIVAKKLEDIKQEAPFAYKGIGPIVETLKNAEIASPVAELRPILTVKG